MLRQLLGIEPRPKTNLNSEYASEDSVGDVVTYWRHKGGGAFGDGKIWVWGWQMRASSEWEQVTKAEYDAQYPVRG